MAATYKQMTDFLVALDIEKVEHTGKNYLALPRRCHCTASHLTLH